MAKAKSKSSRDVRQTVISIKGTAEFRDWLARLADSERITVVQLLEKAVVEYAERKGYGEPAPRRMGGR